MRWLAALALVGCTPDAAPVVAPGVTARFVHEWEPIPACRVRLTSPAPERYVWETCLNTAGCRRVTFPHHQAPYGPGLGSWYPVAGPSAHGLVAGFQFPRRGARDRFVVIREDGSVPVAIDVLDGSTCGLHWLAAGDRWSLAVATSPNASHAISGPLDVRAPADLRVEPIDQADWPLVRYAADHGGDGALENGVLIACSIERARGADPVVVQPDGRKRPLASPSRAPTIMASDCDRAIGYDLEANLSATCIDMPGCGSRVAHLLLLSVK
jgi:hypothetical protein